jgi:predicted nuclease with TOPRIM domain
MSEESYTHHYNPPECYGYLQQETRERLPALSPDDEEEDRAPWRVASQAKVNRLLSELEEIRSENEQLKEQLRELTTELIKARTENNSS